MAENGGGKAKGQRGGVVRRPPSERKRLDPEYEALARGEQDRLPKPSGRSRLRDPRAVALVAGVANRDTRTVLDARLARMQRAREGHPDDAEASRELARQLAEAVRLGVWRGRSITGFDAFAEQLVGLDPGEARRLAQQGAEALGVPCERASDEAVAAWMRAEAALLDAGIDAHVSARGSVQAETLHLELPADRAPLALEDIARRMGPLARDRRDPSNDGKSRAPGRADRRSGNPRSKRRK